MSQLALFTGVRTKPGLKSVSIAVITAESLDILTTFWGLILFPQMWETNQLLVQLGGWLPVILAKVMAVIVVVIVLEKVEKWSRLVWMVPLTAFSPVLWNCVCILAEALA